MFLQIVLPLLVVQSLLMDGARELAIAEHRTAHQVEIAANLYNNVDFIGLTHSGIEDAFLGIVVGIGRIDIGHEGSVAVGTLHVVPAHEVLVGLANQVERYVLKHGSDALQMVVFVVGEHLTFQLLLAQAQQELGLLA